MRNVAFLALGLALLVLQANVFRALDGVPVWLAAVAWVVAIALDAARMLRQTRGAPGRPGAIATFRADLVLPATVLLGYTLLVALGHPRVGPADPGARAARSSSSWACTSTRSRAGRRWRSCSATRPT